MSSIRISRSSDGISRISALRKVVLPLDVPPDTRMFLRARTASDSIARDVAGVEQARELDIGSRTLADIAALRLGERAGRDIIVERQVGRDVLADRQRQRPARRGRCDDLDARTVGQSRRQQRMLAADPLVRQRGDLPREPIERRRIERGGIVALDRAADRLHPDLAGAVDVDVGDVVARQHRAERREIAFEIDGIGWRLSSWPPRW